MYTLSKVFICSILLLCTSLAHSQQRKQSDLQNHIDSIFTTHLGYKYDSNSYLKPNNKPIQVDKTRKGIVDNVSNPLPLNPPPIIVIDKVSVKKEKLTHLTLEMVEEITVLKSENSTALYGQSGKNGAVIVTTKQPKKTKKLIQKTYEKV